MVLVTTLSLIPGVTTKTCLTYIPSLLLGVKMLSNLVVTVNY